MHTPFMRRCLELAMQGRGNVGNGALVGAVLVRKGEIIAEGVHEGFGKPHAERALLNVYTRDIHPDDTLYVNLEPCCHLGKTPPCTDILIERGVKRVVYGMRDPDARVSGRGIALLRSADIEIIGPVLPELCQRLNRGFIAVRTKHRPWITMKRAQTKDGRIANPDGSPLKITSQEQDVWSHTWLRATHDAILVGVQTVINDDPSLTVRYLNTKIVQPWRIILDPHARMPVSAKVLHDEYASRTLVVVSTDANPAAIELLRGHGAGVLQVRSDAFLPALFAALMTPCEGWQGVTSILVEGGAKTWEGFKKEKCFDEEVVLVGD